MQIYDGKTILFTTTCLTFAPSLVDSLLSIICFFPFPQIKEMEQQWQEMEVELNEYRRVNATLKLDVKAFDQKQTGLGAESQKQVDENSVLEDEMQTAQVGCAQRLESLVATNHSHLLQQNHSLLQIKSNGGRIPVTI